MFFFKKKPRHLALASAYARLKENYHRWKGYVALLPDLSKGLDCPIMNF